MPALEAAHAFAALEQSSDIVDNANVVVCISGHGDSKVCDTHLLRKILIPLFLIIDTLLCTCAHASPGSRPCTAKIRLIKAGNTDKDLKERQKSSNLK